ncbi:hypothetical protein J5N97_004360 [Dioscorea zingiberensis]|uniref:BZIP domain-containing protein n=1 Tax=Dioscorea zingiberensis TaxID=325984 RepID=A0A9D5D7R4_9LILI|nr:hypothetical protein J5N97_004360 [Dioscorea zingiberensis]
MVKKPSASCPESLVASGCVAASASPHITTISSCPATCPASHVFSLIHEDECQPHIELNTCWHPRVHDKQDLLANMAHLPPKVPNNTMSTHHRVSSAASFDAPAATSVVAIQPSWVDEFLDFTSVKRSTHRRSVSDSVTFLEAQMIGNGMHQFDRLDEDQLMSLFSDDMPMSSGGSAVPAVSSSSPSTPSDHNSASEEQPGLPCEHQTANEAESACKTETPGLAAPADQSINMDPKRVKRILANRQSAQRSRVRKLQYISELERSVATLQTEVSALSPRVAFLDHQRSVLTVGNGHLKQRIAALAQDKIFKDGN